MGIEVTLYILVLIALPLSHVDPPVPFHSMVVSRHLGWLVGVLLLWNCTFWYACEEVFREMVVIWTKYGKGVFSLVTVPFHLVLTCYIQSLFLSLTFFGAFYIG